MTSSRKDDDRASSPTTVGASASPFTAYLRLPSSKLEVALRSSSRISSRRRACVDGLEEVAKLDDAVLVEPPAQVAQGAVASTEDTATVAARRGRGLAGWVKAESLRRLRADRPDVRHVTTTNAAGNEPILALNRRLGFERVAVATTASVSLEGASVQ